MVRGHGNAHRPPVEGPFVRSTTFNGQLVWVLDIEPDWSSPFVADLAMTSNVEEGLTVIESRRPLSSSILAKLGFRITAIDADARRLANGLKLYQNEPLGVPLWPAAVDWSKRDARQIVGGVNLVFRTDGSQWEVYFEGEEPDWTMAGDIVVPLLVGRLEQRAIQYPAPRVAQFDVSFTESSPARWALRPVHVDFDSGPVPSDAYATGPLVFPAAVDYQSPSIGLGVFVHRQQIGFGRQASELLYPQATRIEFDGDHIAVGSTDIGRLVQFFRLHGTGRTFWIPMLAMATRLLEDIPAGVSSFIVDGTGSFEVGDFVAFVSGPRSVIRRITAKNDVAITVDAPPGPGTAAETVVCHCRLVRIIKPSLRIEWESGNVVTCKVGVRELPDEYNPVEGETLGQTLGLLWHRVFLYEVTYQLEGGEVVERFTSHEEDVSLDGVLYTAARISHGATRQGVALDRDVLDVTLDSRESTLIRDAATLRCNAPLKIVVRVASISRFREFDASYDPEAYQ